MAWLPGPRADPVEPLPENEYSVKGRASLRTSTLVARLAIAAAVACGASVAGQQPQPQNRVSPHETVSATIGDAEITITYGRPYRRGRAVFGALVPYDRVWCPGADEATTLDSTRPLLVGDLKVPPGPHTIWMVPAAERWTLVVSKEPSGFHTRYNASADLGRVPLDKRMLANAVEQLTFAIDRDRTSPTGAIRMMWEQTEVWFTTRVVE